MLSCNTTVDTHGHSKRLNIGETTQCTSITATVDREIFAVKIFRPHAEQ